MFATRIGVETINVVVRAFATAFEHGGSVLDIGSYYTEEYAALCDRRPMFPKREYVGCDLRQGAGVDRIENVERGLSFSTGAFRTILLLETLEHVAQPARALSEVHRVLAPEGVALVSTPFNYRLHGFPTDYWRFTPSGMYEMLSTFPQRSVLAIGPVVMPSTVFAVVGKGRSDFDAAAARLQSEVRGAMVRHKWRHGLKVLEERSRELIGLLTGRSHVGVSFYDPAASGGYSKHST